MQLHNASAGETTTATWKQCTLTARGIFRTRSRERRSRYEARTAQRRTDKGLLGLLKRNKQSMRGQLIPGSTWRAKAILFVAPASCMPQAYTLDAFLFTSLVCSASTWPFIFPPPQGQMGRFLSTIGHGAKMRCTRCASVANQTLLRAESVPLPTRVCHQRFLHMTRTKLPQTSRAAGPCSYESEHSNTSSWICT